MERFAIKIDKSLRANLYKICRLCGIDNPDKVKVLDDETIIHLEDGEPELWKKVLDCIGLLITKDDKMPQFMCTLCVDKINDFFEFREMCYATDGQTRKLLGIKEEPKLKTPPSVDCKTEEADIKQPLPTPHRSGRKRRNADQEICNTAKEIKADLTDDVKSTSANTNTTAAKKKRLKMDLSEADTKPDVDIKPGPSTSKATGVLKTGKPGPASKMGPASKVALQKKLLKVEPTANATSKEKKPTKVPKVLKRRVKSESPPPEAEIPQGNKSALPLQIQKKKKTLELLKQRKQLVAKKVAVVKVEKMRKSVSESKIKEEAPVATPADSTPSLPKVKLKDKCTICCESFVNKALLDKHIKVTHIPYIARYHCVHCNETLKKNMEIKNHNLWHKLSKTPFICGNCSESCCSIYTYSKHVRDCSQVAYIDAHVPDWHCPECSGVYETTYLFNIHSCVSNRLVCPGCDRSLKWKEDFIKHIPTCPAAVHRIPAYMSTTIQVKNEAELPTSPIPPNNSSSGVSLQPTPTTRITAPLMDSNQCVVIPGNVSLIEEAPSPSPKGPVSKKGKRITKKDLKRFDKLLKSTMTTLVSIKQEPAHGEGAVENDGGESGGGDEDATATADDEDAGMSTESPPRSPPPAEDDFHHNDDSDDCSAEEQTASLQPAGTIKQEIIDEGYRDLYNDIEVNIKREVVLNQIVRSELSPAKKNSENVNDVESTTPKPVLKLKITMEHGTLNSVLLDSPKSEKKKKKKKRKEEKHKAFDKEDTPNVVDEVHVPNVSNALNDTQVPNVSNVVEDEPAMPMPGIVCIKQEIAEPEDIETDLPCQSSIPSIVAATSGTLQIACVSEGVQFGAAEENEELAEENEEMSLHGVGQDNDAQEDTTNWDNDEAQPPLDVKPRLDDLIPMLRIAAVSSANDLISKQVRPPAKRKRRSTSAKPSTSTPQISSVSSMGGALLHQSEEKNPSGDGEEFCEKVDDNENIFDFMQVKIKEEVVDSAYDEHSKISQEHENNDGNDDDVDEQDDEEELETPVSKKQADENDYIANIDFNNLNIKQEKEYIDDGLDSTAAYHDDNTSDTESESSSESESENDDTESEREYRELPENDAPLELQIAAVHSKFSPVQSDEKTESNHEVELNSDKKITGQVGYKENLAQIDPVMDCEMMEMSKQPSAAVTIDSVVEMELVESVSSTTEPTTLHNCSASGTEQKSVTHQAEKDLSQSKEDVSKLNVLCDPSLINNVPHEMEMEQTDSVHSVTEPNTSHALSSVDSITQSSAQEVEMELAESGQIVSESNPLHDLSSIDTEAVSSPPEVELELAESGHKFADTNPSHDLSGVDVEAECIRTKTSIETEADMELTDPGHSVFNSNPLLDLNKAEFLRDDVEMVATEPADTAQESSRSDVEMELTESGNSLPRIESSNDLLSITNEAASSNYEVDIVQPRLSQSVFESKPSIGVEAECFQLNPLIDSETEALHVVEMEVTESVDSVSKTKTFNQHLSIGTEAGSPQNKVEMELTNLSNSVAKSKSPNDVLPIDRAAESSSFEVEIEQAGLRSSVAETNLSYLPSVNTEQEYSPNDVEMKKSVSSNSMSKSSNDLLSTDTESEVEMENDYVIESKSSQNISTINTEPSPHPLEIDLYGSGVSSTRLSDSLTDTSRPLDDIELSRMHETQLPSTANQACMTRHEPMEQVQSHLDISTFIHKKDHVPSSLVMQDLADHSVNETSRVSSIPEPIVGELLKCDRETKADEASTRDNSNIVSANVVKSRLPDVNKVLPTYIRDIQTYFLTENTTQETTNSMLINQIPPLQPAQCDDDITMSEVDPIVSEIEGLIQEPPSHMSLHPPGDVVREINKLLDDDPTTEITFSSSTALDDRTRSREEPSVSICVSDRDQGASIESVANSTQNSFNILNSYNHTFDEQPALPMPQTTSALQDILPDVMSQLPVAVLPSECTNEFNPTNTNLTDISCSSIQISNAIDSTAALTTLTAGQLLPTPVGSNLLPSSSDLSIPVLTEEVQNILNEDTVAANQFQLNDTILQAAQCSTSSSSSMYPQFPTPAVLIPASLQNFTDLENVNEIAENNNNANIERELQDELGNVLAAAIANDEVDDNNVRNENRANFDIT